MIVRIISNYIIQIQHDQKEPWRLTIWKSQNSECPVFAEGMSENEAIVINKSGQIAILDVVNRKIIDQFHYSDKYHSNETVVPSIVADAALSSDKTKLALKIRQGSHPAL